MITVSDLPDIPLNSLMEWSKELKALRKELGFTQSRMAEVLGMSGMHVISMLENGHRPITKQTIQCMEYVRKLNALGQKL